MRELIELLKELIPCSYVWSPSTGHLNQAGKYAIGMVIQPGPRDKRETLRLAITNPRQLANLWGHTALYLRSNGEIVSAIGYDPNRLAMFNIFGEDYTNVSKGYGPTPGYVYDELGMFLSPDSICVELQTKDFVIKELMRTTGKIELGPSKSFLQQYLTYGGLNLKPNIRLDRQLMGNCIDFVEKIMKMSSVSFKGIPNSRQGHLTKAVLASDHQLNLTITTPIRKKIKALKKYDYRNKFVTTMPTSKQITRRMGGIFQSYGTIRTIGNAISCAPYLSQIKTSNPERYLPMCVSMVTGLLVESVPDHWKNTKKALRIISDLSNIIGIFCFIAIICSVATSGFNSDIISMILYIIIGLII